MKKSVVITLAGTSSRFSRSVGGECHKSFYRETPEDDCLLDWQLDLAKRHGFEQIVLVGGYKYEELEDLEDRSVYCIMHMYERGWKASFGLF